MTLSLKHLFRKKPLVLCVHGFGRRREREFDNFKLWGKKDYEFVSFNIFDDKNMQDVDAQEWVSRCEQQIELLLKQNRDISVLGFSMGGVLASHLASKYPIKRLILFAPAFEYMSIKNVYSAFINLMSSKHGDISSLNNKQTLAFSQVVDTCKASIQNVQCPVLFLHGDRDDVIPLRSSLNAYAKVPHQNKRLVILHEGVHRLMLYKKSSNETYQLFDLFMKEKIVTYAPPLASEPEERVNT
ncbi:MAG: alpha/beta hydrolase [Breznakia sp.]